VLTRSFFGKSTNWWIGDPYPPLLSRDGRMPTIKNTNRPERTQFPASVKIIKFLFFLMGTIWLVLGISYLIKFDTQEYAIYLFILMVINAAILYWLGWGITRKRVFFYFGIGYLLLNILLTITDQFGLLDLLTMLIDIVLVILLIAKHKIFRLVT
jgi:hypothetical protein